MLGDHGLIYKGSRFFEGLVYVPLIFSRPGKIQSDIVSSALVELVDLAPTILDAAGIDIPYYMQGKSLFKKCVHVMKSTFTKPIVVAEFNDSGISRIVRDTHATMTFTEDIKQLFIMDLDLVRFMI